MAHENNNHEMNYDDEIVENGNAGYRSGSSSRSSNHGATPQTSEKYCCAFCAVSFPNLTQLREHEQEHAAQMPYRCNLCGKGFKHKKSRDRHRHQHTGEKSHKCPKCNASFYRSDHLKIHIRTHDGGRMSVESSPSQLASASSRIGSPVTCSICDATFNNSNHLLKHMDQEHSFGVHMKEEPTETESNTYSCGLCSASFGHVSLLQTHTLTAHALSDLKSLNSESPHVLDFGRMRDPRYACEHCNRSFDSILSLHQHISITHGRETDSVSSSVEQSQSLPVETERGSAGGSFECSVCSLTFSCVAEFAQHMTKHGTHSCKICAAELSSTEALNLHMTHHYAHREVNYTCKGCQIVFSRGDDLQNHLIQAHASQVFHCSLCSHMVESRVQMQVHLIAEHSREMSEWRCRKCNATFSDQDRFQLHVQVVHMGGNNSPKPAQDIVPRALITCSLCQKTCSSQAEFTEHCAANHPSYSCHYCGKDFAVQYLFEKHIQTEHAEVEPMDESAKPIDGLLFSGINALPNIIKCNICDEKYDSMPQLAEHKLKHCKVTNCNNCNVCQEQLGSIEEFFMHTKRHNLNSEMAVACIACKQSLIAPVEVETHAKFHFGVEESVQSFECWNNGGAMEAIQVKSECPSSPSPGFMQSDELSFQCLKCQKKFGSEAEVQSHVTSHVLNEGVTHACLLCQQVFDSPSKLQCHLIDHSFVGCSQLQCYLCGLVFSLAAPLQIHMTSQHAFHARPYECNQCDLKFFFSAEMDHHLLEHKHTMPVHLPISRMCGVMEIEGSHPCPHCPKVFNSLSALQGHSHVHMVSKNHKCAECHKMFSSATKLRNHARVHAGDKPFSCHICMRQFSRKDNLKVHMRSHSVPVKEDMGVEEILPVVFDTI